jgi:hypothetical protein
MKPSTDHEDSEHWTGEPDTVAALALAACLAIAALVFVLLAAAQLHG